MIRLPGIILLLTLLSGAPAWSATGLDAARVEAREARAKVNAIRSRQMALRSQLNGVAARIEELKAEQKGALLTGGELDASLRRSQELSSLLTTAAQQLAQAEADSERGHLALLKGLSSELDSLRSQWDRTEDRPARAALLRKMRELRAERDQVRALIPASKVPALESSGSDDPEDLLEQADALRDSEDKVKQQMAALRHRISELREEQELDRRMNDFLGDEGLFDDQDRRLRRVETRSLAQGSAPPLKSDSEGTSSGVGFGTSEATGSKDSGPRTVTVTQVARGADSRPVVGGAGAVLPAADVSDLRSLEAELKKLEKLARQLGDRASAIEEQARALE